MKLGPEILWIGIEIAPDEEHLRLDEDVKPVKGRPMAISVVKAGLARAGAAATT